MKIQYLRFKDLQTAGIVNNRATLYRLDQTGRVSQGSTFRAQHTRLDRGRNRVVAQVPTNGLTFSIHMYHYARNRARSSVLRNTKPLNRLPLQNTQRSSSSAASS